MFQNLSHDLTTINKSKTHFTSACVDESYFYLHYFIVKKSSLILRNNVASVFVLN